MGPFRAQHVSGGQDRTKVPHNALSLSLFIPRPYHNTFGRSTRAGDERSGGHSFPCFHARRSAGLACSPSPNSPVKSPAATASRRDGRVPSEVF